MNGFRLPVKERGRVNQYVHIADPFGRIHGQVQEIGGQRPEGLRPPLEGGGSKVDAQYLVARFQRRPSDLLAEKS